MCVAIKINLYDLPKNSKIAVIIPFFKQCNNTAQCSNYFRQPGSEQPCKYLLILIFFLQLRTFLYPAVRCY